MILNKKKINNNFIYILFIFVLFIGLISFGISNYNIQKENEVLIDELNNSNDTISSMQNELDIAQENLLKETEKSIELNEKVNELTRELQDAKDRIAYLDNLSNAHNGWAMCWREVNLDQQDIDFFAKLLYCEAGIMGHEGQFWTASAILNLSHNKQMSIWDMGHNVNIFEVAPWVDDAVPTQQQYDIIYEVLNNGWIADVAYFRTDYPHSFGNFMIQIENVCFNSP